VTLFIITLLFDYWAAMQLDNRLKLMSHRAITAINSSGDLSTSAKVKTSLQASGEWARIQTLCPSSQPTLDIKTRVGDLNQGQTQIETFVTYNKFNHLGSKRLSSTIISYSYNDQNGSFQLECI
jgi:hypothetical protein